MKLKNEIISKFGIELDLNPNPLEIKPGESKFVFAHVTNLGELKDNFTVSVSDTDDLKIIAEIYRQDTLELSPGKTGLFSIMVRVKDGAVPGWENITVMAHSLNAKKAGLTVENKTLLVVEIIVPEVIKPKSGPDEPNYWAWIALVIVIIIILLIVAIMLRRRKREVEKQEIPVDDNSSQGITDSDSEISSDVDNSQQVTASTGINYK